MGDLLILGARRGIGADTAPSRARFFATTPESWLDLRQSHDPKLALKAQGWRKPCAPAAGWIWGQVLYFASAPILLREWRGLYVWNFRVLCITLPHEAMRAPQEDENARYKT